MISKKEFVDGLRARIALKKANAAWSPTKELLLENLEDDIAVE